ncbi:hypothetical protein LSH36_326g01027 [Paralvinella palmiformis]|uniref:EF-hand domain-containing protein n=1 Tax=Paralvinella palmiformis TaxID=53620 RepID=A0AAD9JHY5_9ANNE|nr:hypothetical protein LSH36_326g01027 [Paralvinella palmiformis]
MSGWKELTPEEIENYRYHFRQFDLNGDGVISTTELKVVFKNMGYRMSEEQIKAIMKANDIDENGSLSFDEFVQAMPRNSENFTEEEHRIAEMRRKFMEYDKDGNGVVTFDEAHEILEKELAFTPEQSVQLMKKYDKDGDGELSYEEFVKFYTKVKAKADQIQKMFNEFDKDGSGSVSVNEAKDVLRKLKIPDHEIECLVAQHDKNNDGELQYEEFVSFLLHT